MHKSSQLKPAVTIVGGGPAGIATALQLHRYDIEPTVFEKHRLGGLLWNAHRVENYPGFPNGVSGAALAKIFAHHLQSLGTRIILNTIQNITFPSSSQRFVLESPDKTYEADIVVIATGTRPLTADYLDMVPSQLRSFVHFEVYPLLKHRHKKIVIIGAGDISFDYAIHLSPTHSITICHRSSNVKALPLLFREIEANPATHFIPGAVLKKVEKGVRCPLSLTFQDKDNHIFTREADFLVIAIGREPQTLCLAKLMENGIIEDLTSRGRLYFAGDVGNGRFRQAAIAAGNGIQTAMQIHEAWVSRHDK